MPSRSDADGSKGSALAGVELPGQLAGSKGSALAGIGAAPRKVFGILEDADGVFFINFV